MDEHWVEPTDRLFNGEALTAALAHRKAEIDRLIAATADEDVLVAAVDEWSRALGDDHQLKPPRIDISAAEMEPPERVQVNCTGKPGIRYSASEFARAVLRPGYRFESRVPVAGNSDLLRSRLPNTQPLLATISDGHIVRVWTWPKELGTEPFEREVGEYKAMLKRSAEIVAAAIIAGNATLADHARATIEVRRQEIVDQEEFLGKLTIPVKPAEDAPREFGPPAIVRIDTPARTIGSPDAEPEPAVLEPQLDEFYEHILSLIRTVNRSLERTPGSFATAAEENLRDLTLVTLNTHYRGTTYAEAFNGAGKTDILIRVYDHNAFIGECKWWDGPKTLEKSLKQLFGYLTARDTRAALVFYVPNKNLSTTVATTREALEARNEFVNWLESYDDFELRCRMRSPDDDKRVVTLATMFVHLPGR